MTNWPDEAAPERNNARRQVGDEALRACQNALVQERQRFDQFVSVVSHELRGPLATLIGYAQLIGRDGRQPSPLREKAAHSILDQARRLNLIIENMLQASRIAGGRLRIERQPTALAAVLKQVVDQQQAAAPNHRLTVDAPYTAIIGDWDSSLLTLALSNVLSNAVKFSPSGGEVAIRVQSDPHCAIVTVTDKGIGVAREDLPHLFEPYRRSERTTHFPGIGVGLFVARGIVEALGGDITVRSRPNHGATFRVSLPISSSIAPGSVSQSP